MLSRSVAAIHKEVAPHHAAPAAPAAPVSPFDFSQLVGDAQSPASNGSTGNGSTPSSTNTPSSAPPKAKLRHDIADATNAAAAQMPQAPRPTLPLQSAAQPPAPSSNAQILAATASASAPPPSSGANAQGAAGADGNAGDQNGQTASLPLGAADLEARIAIGAPTLLSQPSTALAGLWHHGGEPGGANPQAQSGQDQGNSAGPDDPGNHAPAQAGLAAKTADALAAAAASTHAAPGGDSVAAAKPDAAAAASAVATPDAAAPAAASFALPGAGDIQAAAAAPGANSALPMPMPHSLPAYEQVAINLKQAAQSGTDRIEIQLKPASLGAIAVKLDVTHDGRITAVISADRSDTLNMLRQDSAALQQALRDAGLQADAGSLSFNLRGDAQSFAQNSAPAQTVSSPAERPQAATSDHAGGTPSPP